MGAKTKLHDFALIWPKKQLIQPWKHIQKIISIWKRLLASLHPEELSQTQAQHSLWLAQRESEKPVGDQWVHDGCLQWPSLAAPTLHIQMPSLEDTACWHSGSCCRPGQRKRMEGAGKWFQPGGTQDPGHSTCHYPPWRMGGYLTEVRPPPLLLWLLRAWESNASII